MLNAILNFLFFKNTTFTIPPMDVIYMLLVTMLVYFVLIMGILPWFNSKFLGNVYIKKLSTADKRRDWNCHVISTFNALMTFFWCVKLFLDDSNYNSKWDIFHSSHGTQLMVANSLAYHIYDLIYNCLLYPNILGHIITFHHVFLGLASYFSVFGKI